MCLSVCRVQRFLSSGHDDADDLPLHGGPPLPHLHSRDVQHSAPLYLQRRDGEDTGLTLAVRVWWWLLLLHSDTSDSSETSSWVFVDFCTTRRRQSSCCERELNCVCLSGDRAPEEREADVGASDSLGRAEVGVWRSAIFALDEPLCWTQTTNLSPQTHP